MSRSTVLYELASEIAAWTNPHVHFDMRDLPLPECAVKVEDLKEKMFWELMLEDVVDGR